MYHSLQPANVPMMFLMYDCQQGLNSTPVKKIIRYFARFKPKARQKIGSGVDLCKKFV
jgi:hypothetical protein